jgi:preprotein translocase subunit YajC
MLKNSMSKFERMALSPIATLVAALVLSVVALAQGQKPVEQKVSFYLDGKIGAEVVKKGTYTVVIPEADQGSVEIKVGKKTITAQFTKRQNKEEADADKMTYRDNGDGTRVIATITPRGRKFTLMLEESGVASK